MRSRPKYICHHAAFKQTGLCLTPNNIGAMNLYYCLAPHLLKPIFQRGTVVEPRPGKYQSRSRYSLMSFPRILLLKSIVTNEQSSDGTSADQRWIEYENISHTGHVSIEDAIALQSSETQGIEFGDGSASRGQCPNLVVDQLHRWG